MTGQTKAQNANDLDAIQQVIHGYFDGLHRGDVELLQSLFDEQAHLQAPGVRRSRDQWLDGVRTRQAPEELGNAFEFRLLAMEILGDQAIAKVDAPLLGNRYIDYLGLLKENGQWRIVNKMYADYAHKHPSNNGNDSGAS